MKEKVYTIEEVNEARNLLLTVDSVIPSKRAAFKLMLEGMIIGAEITERMNGSGPFDQASV